MSNNNQVSNTQRMQRALSVLFRRNLPNKILFHKNCNIYNNIHYHIKVQLDTHRKPEKNSSINHFIPYYIY